MYGTHVDYLSVRYKILRNNEIDFTAVAVLTTFPPNRAKLLRLRNNTIFFGGERKWKLAIKAISNLPELPYLQINKLWETITLDLQYRRADESEIERKYYKQPKFAHTAGIYSLKICLHRIASHMLDTCATHIQTLNWMQDLKFLKKYSYKIQLHFSNQIRS